MDVVKLVNKNLRRRTEDVDYWRKRAGWFDDDVSMKEFNNGVYDTYYQVDDDGALHRGSATETVGEGSNEGIGPFLKLGAGLLAVIIAILLYRALSRRSSSSRKVGSSSKGGTSDAKSSRSRSRSSRSRSRSRKANSSSNYELMDDAKSEARSRKSSRSRSRSRRRSKSRKSRSRSKGRHSTKKEVLV